MNNKKYLNTFLASTVAASMVAPQVADAQTAKFNDVNKSYAKQNIEYLAKKGIIDGVSKDKFSPTAVMNRETFAALLGKTLKLKEKAGGSSYKDVSPWAQGIVGALEEKDLVSGLGKGYFGAKMPVTREQMAVFYVRALGYEEEAIKLNLPLKYKDAKDVSAWARPLVAFAEEIGFIKGYPDGTFKPKKGALREDVAALSYRLLDPENTDKELAGGKVKENRYLKKANEVVKQQALPLTIDAGDISKSNVTNYLVKGSAQAGSKLQITITYEGKNGTNGFSSKTVTADSKGKYEKAFDLTGIPNGKVTLNVGYWATDGATPKAIQKVVNKNVVNSQNPQNPETPQAVITSIKALSDVSIVQGGTYTLPKEATVVFKDGKEAKRAVTWNTSSVKVDTVGTYTVQGTVAGTTLKASIKVIVKAKALTVNSIKTINPTDITVTLNRALASGEKVLFTFNGVALDATKVTMNKQVATLKVPTMNDEQIYELIVKKQDGTEIFKESIKFDLNAPSKIETVPVGYTKQVGEKVQVRYVLFDEDGDPLEGARVRIQVQYYDSMDLETKVIEEVVTSGKNGEIVYEYTSLDARRDVVSAISVDNPANVRNEGNVTVEWSLAKSGLIEVDVPQDADKGEGNYRKYTATFKDEAGKPLPKGTKVFVYFGEQSSASTEVNPTGDFKKTTGNEQYAEAVIGNFEGKAVLYVTDVAGKTVKPLFYYHVDSSNTSYVKLTTDPRVQAGATMFKKQIPTFKLTDSNAGKIDVGKTKTVQLEATDQFGEPYLGMVYVGLEQALDNLNETKYGDILFDIDINRDGNKNGIDALIGEKENKTGKEEPISINFKEQIKNGHSNRSVVDLIVKGGSHLDKADLVAYVDDNKNGSFDSSDYHVKTPVEFEDLYIKDIVVEGTTNRLAEGNKAYFTVSFKDQHGQEIQLDANQKADLAFQVLDEAGNIIADYNDSKNKISLEDDYDSHVNKTADYVPDPSNAKDNGDTLSYAITNPMNKFVIEFSSDYAAKYKLRVFLDEQKPTADQRKQDDELYKEVDIVVEGPVLTSGEVMATSKYSIDTIEQTFKYALHDQNRELFKAKEDVTVQYKVTNTGTTEATVVDGSNRTYSITPGQTLDFEDLIKTGQSSYEVKAKPKQKGDVKLSIQAKVKDKADTLSTTEITWVPVTVDEATFAPDEERIYTGKVISFGRKTSTEDGWYVIKTSVGNVKISYKTENTQNKFIVDYNTDPTGLTFNEQITVGDEISWEYDGAGKEKHTLINK